MAEKQDQALKLKILSDFLNLSMAWKSDLKPTASGNTSLSINHSSRKEKSTVWFFALIAMSQASPEL